MAQIVALAARPALACDLSMARIRRRWSDELGNDLRLLTAGSGTLLPRANAAECPQLAEADVRPLREVRVSEALFNLSI